MREYEAVVFDMDGVIFDSEKKVVECWQVLADKYGFTGIEEACRACLGTTKEKSKEIMLRRYGEDFPYETYSAEASKLFHERYDGGRLPKKPGIEKFCRPFPEKAKRLRWLLLPDGRRWNPSCGMPD
jgi:beta-phosphoglucomutase-like phosphatase (HAD superfamily)